MSYLSDVLRELMLQKGIKNVDLARSTGIDQATISRWLNGGQKSISDEDLERVCRTLSSDPREQAQIVAARMRDVQTGPGSQLVKLSIGEDELKETPPKYGSRKLPQKYEAALDNIADNVLEDSDLNQMVLALGRMYSSENLARKKGPPK